MIERKKIVLLGMMSKMPVAGVVWQTVHYLVGFQRLGYDVYYVEAHARTPSMFMAHEADDGSGRAAAFIAAVMGRFDLGDRWAFHALHENGGCYGLSETQLKRLYGSADLLINLHGGTLPLPEHSATGRLIYLETDPVALQIELYDNVPATIDFLEQHCAFFTFGENYGQPDCRLPVSERFRFRPTRQPVVVDFWQPYANGAGETFTTIGNWKQPWREIRFQGEVYHWSKHHEFLKFLDLPGRTNQAFELALSSYEEGDRQLLQSKGWQVRPALDFSGDIDAYRQYIAGSRGEFTVAKDQNVRLRSGWFSDRSATYLAAGRPVVTQETGFSNVLPTGQGLFTFSTVEEIVQAIECINSDYERHSRAALALAREYFSSDVVLPGLLTEVSMSVSGQPAMVKPVGAKRISDWAIGDPLPRPAIKVRIEGQVPTALEADHIVKIKCLIKNIGTAILATALPHPVHVSYKWIDPGSEQQEPGTEGLRTPLPQILAPRDAVACQLRVKTPGKEGQYLLCVTLVQEHVAWFDNLDRRNGLRGLVRIVSRGKETDRNGNDRQGREQDII